MIIDNTITFAAADEQVQEIPWVKVKRRDGTRDGVPRHGRPRSPRSELATLPRHTMDCMDCHNRPDATSSTPPDTGVDLAMNGGRHPPRTCPGSRRRRPRSSSAPIPTTDHGHSGDPEPDPRLLRDEYPELFQSQRAGHRERRREHSGHLRPHGLPRHEGGLEDLSRRTSATATGAAALGATTGATSHSEGKVLTRECTVCHTMPQRGPIEALGALPPVTDETWHPFALKGKHAEILCSRCHSPGVRPKLDCALCHKLNAKAPMMSDCTSCHSAPGVKLPVNDCKACHDQMKGLHKKGGHPDASCTDCHKPHVWAVSGRDTCLSCHDDKKEHNKEAGLRRVPRFQIIGASGPRAEDLGSRGVSRMNARTRAEKCRALGPAVALGLALWLSLGRVAPGAQEPKPVAGPGGHPGAPAALHRGHLPLHRVPRARPQAQPHAPPARGHARRHRAQARAREPLVPGLPRRRRPGQPAPGERRAHRVHRVLPPLRPVPRRQVPGLEGGRARQAHGRAGTARSSTSSASTATTRTRRTSSPSSPCPARPAGPNPGARKVAAEP